MIYTNDVHQWVFRFDLSTSNWSSVYSYGPGYLAVYIAFLLPFISGIAILYGKCWTGPERSKIWLPIMTGILFIAYGLGYVFRIPAVYNGDFTLSVCLFIILFCETAMRTGLIPQNTKYVALFRHSSLKMQIVAENGAVAYSSEGAEALPNSFNRDILLYSTEIHGGKVVWQEDVSKINVLEEKIAESLAKIKRANLLLERQEEIQSSKESERSRELLYDILEKELKVHRENLIILAEGLRLSEEKKDEASCRKIVELTNFTATYIKRRCNLVLYAKQETLSMDTFAMYIDELLELARPLGLQSAKSMMWSPEMPIIYCCLLYDFFFSILEYLMKNQVGDLMFHLYGKDREICLMVIANAEFSDFVLPSRLEPEIRQQGGSLTHKLLGDAQSLALSFPEKAVGSYA